MPAVCLYFEVHQPCRLKHYTVFDIDREHSYEDSDANRQMINELAENCYLPANAIILDLIGRLGSAFKIAFSLSGTVIDQLEAYRPDVLESFKCLAETGAVEFLSEPYHHSLAFLFSRKEFRHQVIRHRERIEALFGQKPESFGNTGLIYRNDLAKTVEKMGYRVILAEGADKILSGRSPNFAYQPAACGKMLLLLRNWRLSDDVAFHYGSMKGNGYPLTADEFARRIHSIDAPGAVINISMAYEPMGEHHRRNTGILDFLANVPGKIMRQPAFRFQTPAEVAASSVPVAPIDAPEFISQADAEKDLTAWLGNAMQRDALKALYGMERAVHRCQDAGLLHAWRTLQTSDYFSSMCTKSCAHGDFLQYSPPYASPYDAYINYMNILDDLASSIRRAGSSVRRKTERRVRKEQKQKVLPRKAAR